MCPFFLVSCHVQGILVCLNVRQDIDRYFSINGGKKRKQNKSMLEKLFGLSTEISHRLLSGNLINLCKVHRYLDRCELMYYETVRKINI